jgi:hypothetical protein
MKITYMYKSITSTFAVLVCAAMPALAAEPVAKEKGSKARELQAARAQAQPVKPITTGGIKGPEMPITPANASNVQSSSAPGAAVEPR